MARWLDRGLVTALLFVVLNAAYLAAFDTASIAYHVMVVAHLVAGILLALLVALRAIPALGRLLRSGGAGARALALVATLASVVAVATALRLAVTGTATPYRTLLWTHIGSSIVALAAASAAWVVAGGGARSRRAAWGLVLALAFPLLVRGYDWLRPAHVAVIVNPASPPLSADQEGGGKGSPFWPSSVTTVGNRLVPEDFFLESKACGNKGCHPDITVQWDSSMHHFSSFNNQWYRKSIEYMQEVVGTNPSKWCGGCHDQSILLTGRMDTPIVQQMDTPQAHAGIGCLVCHSVVHVNDTMGQGGYVLEYPEMHKLVASKQPVLEAMHDYMVRLDPGPHKATMLKPFHRESRAEFCSSCHKVHLDVPVNQYRWFRGFNEYDAWQASGISGQGARAFYYPDQPKDCGTCHMPLVKSNDAGNVDGFVHSHRFPAANTAVPFANQDDEQLRITQEFLRANILSVDIFAALEAGAVDGHEGPSGGHAPGAAGAGGAPAEEPTAASMVPEFTDGGAAGVRRGSLHRPGEAPVVVAPIDRAAPFMRPGNAYRIDVVARTRTIGHMFPGGTLDAFDVWLELKGEDATGRVFYWSGWVEDGGRGPVESSAHRYRALLVDEHGNEINKRNAWSARALIYAKLIPPGAADVGRFRVEVPADVKGPLTFTARMNYRKFMWWNTQFSYAGVRDPAVPEFGLSPSFDDGPMLFTGDTRTVSGKIKAIPDLPITVIAEDKVTVELQGGAAAGGVRADLRAAVPEAQAFDRERFNDYGIGMLLQGDLVGARAAFETVNRVEPTYAAGFVNLGRVFVQEGDHEAARAVLEKALSIDPKISSGHYFLGLALKSRGQYDEALEHFRAAAERFPRDRVVRNQIGRVLFLQRRHAEAIAEFQATLLIDPEDVTAHYNLMLCYRALGRSEDEKRQETLYTRFKADEAAQALTGEYRRLHPDDNRERQPIHEHPSRWVVPGRPPVETPTALARGASTAGSGR